MQGQRPDNQLNMLMYLSLGSNQGSSNLILKLAIDELNKTVGLVKITSSVYKTQAWGYLNQNAFLNQVLAVRLNMSDYCKLNFQEACNNILHKINKIENKLGRVRVERWGPRTLDIDILFIDNNIIDNPNLTIPHKQIENRRFVLVPFNEIAPDFVHPLLDKKIKVLLEECQDNSSVELYQ